MLGKSLVAAMIAAGLGWGGEARAWDPTGHKVVAWIAWEAMRPEARQRAVALLEAAPPDADLASLLPADDRPLAAREKDLFLLASTWPDLVRDDQKPDRKAKYNHASWHYVSWDWEQAGGVVRDLPDPPGPAENDLERLRVLTRALAEPGESVADKAVDLAWVLHLVGDIHQPLHCASRVTAQEPKSDLGGNLFKLEGTHNLHAYWDEILTNGEPRRPDEPDDAYLERLGRAIIARFPRAAVASRLDLGHFEAWANAGYDTAKTEVYQPILVRGQAPPPEYRDRVLRIAEPAIALAGYRLAATLERALGSEGGGAP